MSEFDILAQFECQNRMLIVLMRYSASVKMSKYDLKHQNAIFKPNLNVKIGFRMSKFDKKFRPQFEFQKMISKIRYLSSVRISKLDFECQN